VFFKKTLASAFLVIWVQIMTRIVVKPNKKIRLWSDIELDNCKHWNNSNNSYDNNNNSFLFSTGYKYNQSISFDTCVLSGKEQRELFKTSTTLHLATGGKLEDIQGNIEVYRGICFTDKSQGRIKYLNENNSFCIAIGIHPRLFDQSLLMLSNDKKIFISLFLPIKYYREHIDTYSPDDPIWNNDKFDELEIDRAAIIFLMMDERPQPEIE
jgi:hypothetical protein